MFSLPIKRICRHSILLALLLQFYSPLSHSEIVALEVVPGRTATAQFIKGEREAPAILILHGFLQTRDFYTIKRLETALVDSDYTVLTPTLSLGLDRRKQSLPCEAIHEHSLESDVKEIGAWTEWLRKKTGRPPVVIGHSAGGLLLTAFIGQKPEPKVYSSILISLAYFGESPIESGTNADAERARKALAEGNNELDTYGLAYCKKYLTTPANFLSYYDWSRERVSSALSKTTVPVSILVGSADNRIDKTWLKSVRESNISVISVEGANHFFDNEYEFELTDAIEKILSTEM